MSTLSKRTGALLQIIGGALAGLVLTVPLGMLVAALLGGSTQGFVDLAAVLVVSVLAYPVGAAVGVALIGRRLGYTGRFWHALVGAFVPVFVLALVMGPLGLTSVTALLQALFLIFPPIAAAVAYHRFSRPLDPPYDAYDEDVDLLKYHDEGWED